MVNLPKERFREAAAWFCVLAVALLFASMSLRGQVKPGHGVDQVDSCFVDAKSPACLQSRINQLGAQIAELQKRVEGLQRSMAAIDSIGDPNKGKADGFDDLWGAIHDLTKKVTALEKR